MEWSILEKQFTTEADKVILWINDNLSRIRSGRVSLNVLDVVRVEVYGDKLSLKEIANLQIVDAKQILIKPYDRSQIHAIANAITTSKINVNPIVAADSIRLVFPAQTEENRIENVKKAKAILEQAKVAIRNVRKSVQDHYKNNADNISDDLVHYFEEELNKITKKYNQKLEEIFNQKQQELMKV